ncbi:MAG TPA: response regulator transcription factor [Ktedonobacterales bacterium]|nr:response regulator transcription factor [Ktedonobacterales bacterium]
MPDSLLTEEARPTAPVRVLLVDDQALLRESFKRLLELVDGGITVVGVAADGQEALAAMQRLAATAAAPHVVLMDVRMPRLNGVEATRQIVARWPETRVVILSTFDDEELIVSGLRAGARGYLLKDTSSDELVRAIHAAARGETPIQPEVASKLVAHVARPAAEAPTPLTGTAGGEGAPLASDLTEREREILRLVARGASNREVGETLFITEGTVKNHVSNILSKLGLRDRTQAAVYAHEHGLA